MQVHIYWRCMYGIISHTAPISSSNPSFIPYRDVIYLSIYPSIYYLSYLSIYLCVFIYLSFSPTPISIYLSISPTPISIYLPIYLFINLLSVISNYLSIYVYLSIYLSAALQYLSIFLFVLSACHETPIYSPFYELGIQGMIAEVHLRRIERLTVSTVQVSTASCVTYREYALRVCSL